MLAFSNSQQLLNPVDMYEKVFEHYDELFQPNISSTSLLKSKPITTIQLAPKPPTHLLQGSYSNGQVATNRIPPSFTILMNFQNDGTTNLQILHNSVFWSDSVYCKHGQIYDPTLMTCREIFCMQGYILSPQGCIPDKNANTSFSEPIKKPPGQMQIEITLRHSLCVFEPENESNVKCFIIKCSQNNFFFEELVLSRVPRRKRQVKSVKKSWC